MTVNLFENIKAGSVFFGGGFEESPCECRLSGSIFAEIGSEGFGGGIVVTVCEGDFLLHRPEERIFGVVFGAHLLRQNKEPGKGGRKNEQRNRHTNLKMQNIGLTWIKGLR